MFSATWKSLLGRKLRLILSALSIVLGVAFVSGSLMFTNLLSSSFNEILKGAIADINVTVDGLPGFSEQPSQDLTLPAEVVTKIGQLEGIKQATGVVSAPNVYPLNRDGKVFNFGNAPGIAMNWHTTAAADGAVGVKIIEGSEPKSATEVVLDPSTLSRSGYNIGDQIQIATPLTGIKTFKITGTGTYGSGATAGASYLFFTRAELQTMLTGGKDVYTGVWIATNPGTDVNSLTQQVQALLPTGFKAESGAKMAKDLEAQLSLGLSFVNIFLLVFAAIALLVAALLILNTFSILVAQRSGELALFRALGAKRSQIRNSVLFEAVVVALVGASIGLLVGYGLTWLISLSFSAIGIEIGGSSPSLTWQAVVASYGVALLITMLAAWIPARRAAATRPVEAMTAAAIGPTSSLGITEYLGLGLIQLGVAAGICGIWLNVPEPLIWVGVGCAAVLVGFVLSAAIVGAPVVWLFGKIFRPIFGEIGKLAELNAKRQPRRTAATAATLMIGLALVSTVSILASSTTASIRAGVEKDRRGDFLILPTNYEPFDATVAQKAKQVAGVEKVWEFRTSHSKYQDQLLSVTGTTPDGLSLGSKLKLLAGGLTEGENSAVLGYETSKKLNLPLGKTFKLPTTSGATIDLLVTGILQESSLGEFGTLVVGPQAFAQLGNTKLVRQLTIKLAPGADIAAARAGLQQTIKELPMVSLTDNQEYADARVAQFNQIFAVIYALLALAIVISVLGILNTLGLSVMERTREIGLLRAVGITRPQLRRLVRLESVVVAVLGSVLGVLLGVLFGAVLVVLLQDSGITELAIPWAQLGIFVALAALFGVIAAIGPASRAARLNVLTAIRDE